MNTPNWSRTLRVLRYTVIALIFLAPSIWLLLGSLLPAGTPVIELVRNPLGVTPTSENYATAATLVPLARFVFNSLRVTVIATPLSVLAASWAAFAMTQLPRRARDLLIHLSVAALLAPPTALWLARFPIFRGLGWIDTPLPLIAPALLGGSPLFVLLLYWSFRRLPDDLLDAARIDGAGVWRVWWSVVMPASRGAVIGVAVLNAVLFWSNFTDPLLYLRSQDQFTLPVGVRLLAQLDPTQWPVLLAGGVLLTAPVLIAVGLGIGRLGD
ncbi:MAG: carbohydrate ABC transporter permease [Caldilineaceae bacterium]|nr:carbohydrate ABC transporter permease [Caldilineaceae bacterium]